MAESPSSSPIAWPLRTWFAVELFFAISASLSVGIRPDLTATNFAWNIQPAVMASLFGAFYLSLTPVIILLLLIRRWEQVRVFVLPGFMFTATQLAVTIMHWDRFSVGTGPFNIWLTSYLLPPPVFLMCYLWQQRHSRLNTTSSPINRSIYRLAMVMGVLLLIDAVATMIWPPWYTASAPWKITPLNARALAGYQLLVGALLLSIVRENHYDRVRIVSPFLVLVFPVVMVQLLRFSNEVTWAHWRIAVNGAALALVSVIGIHLAFGNWLKILRPTN